MKTKNLVIFAAVILLLPAMVSAQSQPPDVKNATIFTGSVSINGVAAPDGTCIKAFGGGGGTDCPGSEGGGTTNGIYNLAVLFQGAPEPITFTINGATAAQSWSLTASDKGRTISLDLSLPSGGTSGGPGGGTSGGTGGGVKSDENESNIEAKECYDREIFKDVSVSYLYSHALNPVNAIDITSNINAGIITSCIEILKGRSSIVNGDVPGTVYKNINIWVGYNGFATPDKIKNAKISFDVPNSWLTNNNIAGNQLKLHKWDGSKWILLDTSQTGSDATSTYFQAVTNSFSPFAISGISEITATPTVPGVTETAVPGVTVTATPPVQPPTALNWILYLVIAIIIIVAVYFLAIKKK